MQIYRRMLIQTLWGRQAGDAGAPASWGSAAWVWWWLTSGIHMGDLLTLLTVTWSFMLKTLLLPQERLRGWEVKGLGSSLAFGSDSLWERKRDSAFSPRCLSTGRSKVSSIPGAGWDSFTKSMISIYEIWLWALPVECTDHMSCLRGRETPELSFPLCGSPDVNLHTSLD